MHRTISLIWLLAAVLTLPSVGSAQGQVHWEATLDSAQRLAGQTNRLVLIEFWAPWCGICQRMEAEVLTQPAVVAEIAADYVPVKINADYFPSTAKQFGVSALPTTVVITPQGQVIDTVRGRLDAAEYVARFSQVAASVKQRRNAVYAQMPAGTVPAPSQTSPAMSQPPMANMSPAAPNAPAQNSNTQPTVGAGQMPGNFGLMGGSYANPSQRSIPTPIAQPSSAPAGAANTQPSSNYALPTQMPMPAQATVLPAQPTMPTRGAIPSPTAVAQAYPPSQPSSMPTSPGGQPFALAATAPGYGSPSSVPMAQPSSNPTVPSAAAIATPPIPTVNPPLGLDGFCPVGLAERQQWLVGDRRWGVIHRGRTYLFSGPEEQRHFLADPDRYAPVISGNDIVLAAEQGQAVPGVRQHGVFFDGRVYLFSNEGTLEKFAKNPNLYANQAVGAIRGGAYTGQQQLRR